jgi:hypothetical protein
MDGGGSRSSSTNMARGHSDTHALSVPLLSIIGRSEAEDGVASHPPNSGPRPRPAPAQNGATPLWEAAAFSGENRPGFARDGTTRARGRELGKRNVRVYR